jgi:uncharacterized membrane protein
MPIQYRIGHGPSRSVSPLWGCLPMFLVLVLMCLLPMFLYDTAKSAFMKLGLSPAGAAITVLGILFGSFINIPIYRIEKDELQPQWNFGPLTLELEQTYRRVQSSTVIAINIGGGVIPIALAVVQFLRLAKEGNEVVVPALIVTVMSIFVCWRVARPVEGIGILIPGFIPPLVSVLATWLLLWSEDSADRAACAFLAGVAGPVIGADLLHLRTILRTPVAMMSIGGAGTFDGIVLSGILAALLA